MIDESVYPNPLEDVLCSPLFSLYREKEQADVNRVLYFTG